MLGLPDSLIPYQADKVRNYELGIRVQPFGKLARIHAAGFIMDWSDMQVSGSRPDGFFRFISNAGTARVQGLEVETLLLPVDGLEIGGAVTLLDARLSDDQVSAAVVAAGRRGDRIPMVPELTIAGTIEYRRPLREGLEGLFRIDGSHSSGVYTEISPSNAFRRRLPGYTLINAKLGIDRGSWSTFLYVTNLTDTVALQSGTVNGATLGRTQVTAAPPRSFGLFVAKRF
ncbi:TonB-dependent receptor domain-containing protein [Sphingomonas canadensis]|uniref:TonB-dependent receptor domain-containing protein n=1 Tax=Sphingomonas canadensis TaxID=1219257 RepID=A0ABW3HB98_9SPHN|nr:TonB-dependent receptor [Sphingomonas canadensis]MCW3838149.1 TonB-dependent receptor [Sphingomonas canadensis]